MDEPGAALDLEAKEEILNVYQKLSEEWGNGDSYFPRDAGTVHLHEAFCYEKGSAHAGDGETVGCGAGFTFLNLKIIDKILQYLY